VLCNNTAIPRVQKKLNPVSFNYHGLNIAVFDSTYLTDYRTYVSLTTAVFKLGLPTNFDRHGLLGLFSILG
jgi:hypothetical protein